MPFLINSTREYPRGYSRAIPVLVYVYVLSTTPEVFPGGKYQAGTKQRQSEHSDKWVDYDGFTNHHKTTFYRIFNHSTIQTAASPHCSLIIFVHVRQLAPPLRLRTTSSTFQKFKTHFPLYTILPVYTILSSYTVVLCTSHFAAR